MSRKSRMQSAREAKDRRMKKIAAGGLVLLVVVLAYEVPHMMKKSGGASGTPASTTATTAAPGASTTPTATTPSATPAATAAAAVLPTASTKLPNSDVAPARSKSQLYSFTHFAGKDPFVQQVGQASTALPPPPPSAAAPAATPTATTAASVSSSGSAPTQSSARTLAQTGAVTISVNGKPEAIRIGGKFPSSNPLFRLVSVAHGVARVGIANGSYASGAQTVSLVAGRALTLVDTADGVRYTLRLVS